MNSIGAAVINLPERTEEWPSALALLAGVFGADYFSVLRFADRRVAIDLRPLGLATRYQG